MCQPQVLSELLKYLAKGQFPLLTQSTTPLWECLLQKLENDAAGFVAALKFNKGVDDPFSSVISVGSTDFDTGFDEDKAFVCYAHRHLCKVFGVAIRQPWQGFIQRLRGVMESQDLLDESSVALLRDPNTGMGAGFTHAQVTLIPDGSLGVQFGSVPDQNIIAAKADCWLYVKSRPYEDRAGILGKKTHYVLAHLLNHQLNGSGANELNVIPFWAAANTQMANIVEKVVKDAVHLGVVVQYTIALGPPMKNDATYKGWSDIAMLAATTKQKNILKWELELPQHMLFYATATDAHGTTVNLIPPGTPIANYVPMSMPAV